jgi:hypothetical protein
MEGKEGSQLLIEFLQGKGANLLFWVVVAVIFLFLLKKVPLVGSGLHGFIVGAGKDVAALGGKGIAWTLSLIFNFVVNFAASALMLLLWATACGLIYGWYLIRLLIATIKETREPPMSEFPTALGWIKLLPIKKPKNTGHGGGHH